MKHRDSKSSRSVFTAIAVFGGILSVTSGCSSPCSGLTRWESSRDAGFVVRAAEGYFNGGAQKTQQLIEGIPDSVARSFRDGTQRMSGTQALYAGCYSEFQAAPLAPATE